MQTHLTTTQLAAALRVAAGLVEWESEALADYQAYAQRFGLPAGRNVFVFVLRDALAHRGVTLDQLRFQESAKKGVANETLGANTGRQETA